MVAFVLHDTGMKAVGNAVDRLSVGIEAGVADALMPRHHATQELIRKYVLEKLTHPAKGSKPLSKDVSPSMAVRSVFERRGMYMAMPLSHYHPGVISF